MTNTTRDPEVITLGCRLNTFESALIKRHAADAGLTNTVIVNTCAVTREAERQARQTIRRLRRDRPTARIIVTGCAAQLHPDRFAAMAEVDRVLGNTEKLDPAAYTEAIRNPLQVTDIMTVRETAGHLLSSPLIEAFDGRSRAFVQIQQGCDHRCTFCIIPFARGPSRSLPVERIIAQIRRLVESGHQEIVLTGVDISSYGRDVSPPSSLGALATDILGAVPDLPRLRLSSLDPAVADLDLIRLIGDEPRLMPHLHLSLQAGDDIILKRMKRRHLTADAVTFCRQIRAVRPDVAFGGDLIAGFPTETEELFANTMEHVEALGALGLVYLHVFPYSAHDRTPSARMPQVAQTMRKERAAKLRMLGERLLGRYLDRRIGATADVLVEDGNQGRSEHYAPVRLTAPAATGTVVRATLAGRDGPTLLGTPQS
jgi:threonylcarbamoyladenosine tRNA methylthiotransferase MtaB